MAVYLFPGQGSQMKGMGGTLFAEFPDLVQKADKILGYSIETLCLEDPDNQLNLTHYTQPALYVVNALHYLKILHEHPVLPSYLAGHSLGEYSALFAASVFNFETGLKLVQKRGELMSQASGGGMAAVIGLKKEVIQTLLDQSNLNNISIANDNSYLQTIITGSNEAVIAANDLFIKAGASMFIPLKVSGAFHSSFMNEAQQVFSDYLSQFKLNAPHIPVIANVNAMPYQNDKLFSNLSMQINHPVLWTQSIEYLLAKGETEFTEIGPGKVLTGLVRKIKNGQ
ncbi:MAG: [acyl-carrier-protein] S-malonyltransferase [Gammaproteobacteria bacterium RIFCSPHIGHO2_12_FULL_45_12]|nr:MAG: [acyl-carrier-protein] S-malonyltransferase [Gammaproteobacteria bacterium RIFCSPHIGHO2_12_FULL_45_12]